MIAEAVIRARIARRLATRGEYLIGVRGRYQLRRFYGAELIREITDLAALARELEIDISA